MFGRGRISLDISFLKDATKLGSASAFSQGLVVLSFPLLTRLYSVAELGEWGTVVAVSGICATVAGGRMELAIPTAEPNKQVSVATTAALLSALSMFVVLIVGLLVGANRLSHLWFWIVPIAIAQHWNSAAQTLAVAQERFGGVAFGSWLMVSGVLAGQLIPKLLGLQGDWLFLGSTVGPLLSAMFLLQRCGRIATIWDRYSLDDFRKTLGEHASKPKLLAPAALLNASALNIPIPIVRAFYGPEWAGVFTVVMRGIGGPLALIGQAVANVYLSRASIILRSVPEELNGLYGHLTRLLFVASLAIFAVIGVLPNSAFVFAFGDQFQGAGQLVRVLLPTFACQFVVAPVALTLTIVGRESWQLRWDMLRLTQATGALIIPALLGRGIFETILIYSATGAIAYLLYDRINRVALRSLAPKQHGTVVHGGSGFVAD